MRFIRMYHTVLLATVLALTAAAQTPAPTNPLEGFTPEQLTRFTAASNQFTSRHFTQALPLFKELISVHPENMMLAKYGSQAAMEAGDYAFAAATLKPIEAAHPEDWQTTMLMARVYAASGDKLGRDREIARMADLHRRGVTPASLKQHIVESVHLADGKVLTIYNSFEPWGVYKVYNYAQLQDADRRMLMRLTLESSDGDQPQFAKEHPAEAAAGARRFSLDGYRTDAAQTGAPATETHFTYGFLDQRPTYDQVRDDFVAIAEGNKPAISSRTGLPVAKDR